VVGSKNLMLRAPLAEIYRKSLRPDNCGNFAGAVKASYMRQLDLQQICRPFMEHRQCVFSTADAFLSGNRNADSAPQFGEAAQVSSGQRLLGIRNAKARKLAQDKSRLDE